MNINPKAKGSIAIEAVLSISLFLFIAFALFGMLISIFIDESMQWATLEMLDEVSLYAMPFMGHDRIIQESINLIVLNGIANSNLNAHVSNMDLHGLLAILPESHLDFDPFGYATYEINYRYKIPSPFNKKTLIIPLCAAITSDGIDFSDGIVYITTYGEKFHKSDCFHLRKSKFGILLSKAKEKGYEACKNCYGNQPFFK